MPEEEIEPQSRWQTPFWIEVRGTIVGGLILAGIVGGIGLVVSLASSLSFGHVLLYVCLPVFLLVVLAGVLQAARSLRRAWAELRDWQEAISSKALDQDDTLLELHRHVLWLHLRDLIADAINYGWTVESHEQGLNFTSPKGVSEFMRFDEIEPTAVAAQLHDLDPDNFLEDWVSPPPRQVLDALTQPDSVTMEQLHRAAERVNALERQLEEEKKSNTNSTIALVIAILRTRGWVAEGMNGNTTYILRKPGMPNAGFDVKDLDIIGLFTGMSKIEAEQQAKNEQKPDYR
jgi:hypothetical protein